MTYTTLRLTALTAALASLPALAFAQLTVGETLGTTQADIRAKLEATGAVISEIETEDGMLEVEYMLDGAEYEATVDLASGMVTEVEIEDEDDEDEDEDDDKS